MVLCRHVCICMVCCISFHAYHSQSGHHSVCYLCYHMHEKAAVGWMCQKKRIMAVAGKVVKAAWISSCATCQFSTCHSSHGTCALVCLKCSSYTLHTFPTWWRCMSSILVNYIMMPDPLLWLPLQDHCCICPEQAELLIYMFCGSFPLVGVRTM